MKGFDVQQLLIMFSFAPSFVYEINKEKQCNFFYTFFIIIIALIIFILLSCVLLREVSFTFSKYNLLEMRKAHNT